MMERNFDFLFPSTTRLQRTEFEDSTRLDVIYNLSPGLNLWLTAFAESRNEIRFIEQIMIDLKHRQEELKKVIKEAKMEYKQQKDLVQSELEKHKEEAVSESDKQKEEATSNPKQQKDLVQSELEKHKEEAVSESDKQKEEATSNPKQQKDLVQSDLEKHKEEAVSESDKQEEEATSNPEFTSHKIFKKGGKITPRPDIVAMQTKKHQLVMRLNQFKEELATLKSDYKGHKKALQKLVEEMQSVSEATDKAKAGIMDIVQGPQLVRLVEKYNLDSLHPLNYERKVLRVTKNDHKALMHNLIHHNTALGLGIDVSTIVFDNQRRFSY